MMDEGEEQALSSSNPGARLAAAREQAGMTLPQAAERLRLDVGTLQALEAGQFHTLGATVFVRGHLRHYAELVGLPVDEIDAEYAASSARLAPLPDLRRTTTLTGNATIANVQLPPRAALIGAIVLVLVALVWWAMRVPSSQHRPASPAGSAPAAGADTTGAPPASGAWGAPNAPGTSAVPLAPSPDAVTPPPTGFQPPAHDVGSRDQGPRDAASTFRDAVLAAKGQAGPIADAAPASVPKTASTRVRLMIHFDQDGWTEIYDAHGATLFHDFGGAGSERRISGMAPLRVLLGNPDGVRLELDGHPVALKPAAQSGRPQRFVLDSGGRVNDVPATPASSTAPDAAPSAAPR
jgi:cytoskeleton protein RodZ